MKEKLLQLKNNLVAKKITVIGAGASGIAAARLAKKAGARVLVSEKNALSEHSRNILMKENITYEEGGHTDRVLNADLIILSPGIPGNIPILMVAKEKGIPVISEIEFAFWFEQGTVIAITGSQGKTTTTSLIGKIMDRGNKRVFIGGNIGFPYSDFVYESNKDTITVLEVSSFQLENIEFFAPQVVVITNLTPNHLDRYDSFEDYVAAKIRIFNNMNQNTKIVYNADDQVSTQVLKKYLSKGTGFSFGLYTDPEKLDALVKDDKIVLKINGKMKEIVAKNDILLLGNHNVLNIMAAALVGTIFKINTSAMEEVFKTFSGIPHRLEFVQEVDGIKFYNDSKATTVSSLRFAIESFTQPIILIAGGKDKGGSFASIRDIVSFRVKTAILIGQSTQRIADEWEGATEILKANSLEEAVQKAYQKANSGEIVLLSPGCSSFDMFQNFEDRGNQFKSLVYNLAKKDDHV